MTHSGTTESRSDSGVRLLRNHGLAELVLDRAASGMAACQRVRSTMMPSVIATRTSWA
jgi:hypothetical protein